MLNIEALREVESLFNTDMMLRVVRMDAIMLTTKMKACDFTDKKETFNYRVKRKFAKLLGEDQSSAEEVFDIVMAAYDVEQRLTLQGLGGCMPITLKDALVKNK